MVRAIATAGRSLPSRARKLAEQRAHRAMQHRRLAGQPGPRRQVEGESQAVRRRQAEAGRPHEGPELEQVERRKALACRAGGRAPACGRRSAAGRAPRAPPPPATAPGPRRRRRAAGRRAARHQHRGVGQLLSRLGQGGGVLHHGMRSIGRSRRLTRYRADPSSSLSCPGKCESFDDDRGTRAGDAGEGLALRGGRKLLARLDGKPPAKGHVLFETGYGPSGLPHIGTFGEVVRTTMVRQAFQRAVGCADPAVRLLRRHGRAAQGAGQRAEPGDAARASGPAADRAFPIRSAATRASATTTTRCCAASSTASASTTSSRARPTGTAPAASTRRCCRVLEHYDAIMAVMLPSLREERRADLFSPFLPIRPSTGPGAAGADPGARRRRRHRSLSRRGRRAGRECRSPAGTASCNGSPTGRCAGTRSASITRCRART